MRTTWRSVSRGVSGAALLVLTGASLGHPPTVVFAPQPSQKIVNVPSAKFPTLQSAVDAFVSDVVIVVGTTDAPQTAIVDGKNNFSIIGTPSPDGTLARIHGDSMGPVLEICFSSSVTVGNLVVEGGGTGIEVHSADVSLLNVSITGGAGHGVYADGPSSITFSGGGVREQAGDGVHLNGVAQASISGLNVEHVGGDGLSANSGTLFVGNSVIYGVGRAGIRVDGAETASVQSTTVNGATQIEATGAGGDGIVVRAGLVDVKSNKVGGFKGRGIVARATGRGGEVGLNRVNDVGGEGVIVRDGVTALRNAVARTGGDGVVVQGVDAKARYNDVTDVACCGIRVLPAEHGLDASGTNEVTENRIAAPTQSGVMVEAPGVVVSQNQIWDAGTAGVAVRADRAQITLNEVNRSHGDGVDLGGSKSAKVIGNDVSGSRGCGFKVDAGGAKNAFKKNVAATCGEWGLWESDAAGKNAYSGSNKFGKAHRRKKHR